MLYVIWLAIIQLYYFDKKAGLKAMLWEFV